VAVDPLASFSRETFAGRVGERFEVAGGPALELADVVDRSAAGGDAPAGARSPFSLVFLGPQEPALGQGTRQVVHPELGDFSLFLVPVAAGPDGLRYEAAFG